jgi:flagellar biosynthesis protein FlhG
MADLSDDDRQRLVDALGELEQQSDVILIDTGAGISPNVLTFTRAADEVLVVTTPEPTAITDAYAVIKVIRRHDGEGDRDTGEGASPSRPLSLLVNQARSATEAALVFDRISRVARQFLGSAVQDAGFVMSDEHVPTAVRQRVPFIISSPKCPASECITRLAMRLERGIAPSRSDGLGASAGFFDRMGKWFKRDR